MPLLDDLLAALPSGKDIYNATLGPLDRAAGAVDARQVEAERYLASPDPAVRAEGERMMSWDPSRIAMGFAGPGSIKGVGGLAQGLAGPYSRLQALRDVQNRLIYGGEQGEAKYAALRENARQMEALQGAPGPTQNLGVPKDLAALREIMDRLVNARLNPLNFKR